MLKKLFLAVLILLAVAAGVLFFLWRQAAQLPDWYKPDAASPGPVEERQVEPAERTGSRAPTAESTPAAVAGSQETPTAVARALRRQLKQEAARNGTLRLDQQELNALLKRALASDPDGRRIRDATRAVRATIDGDRLSVGAVTDLDLLAAAASDARERDAIRKLRRLVPWILGQDFYLGVEGRPQARGGKLAFDGVAVKVGQLSFDPAQLLALLGLPADRLDRELAVRLPDAKLEDVRIEDGSLLLSLAEERSR